MIAQTYGGWLATQRKRHKLTQAGLSKQTGINATYISKIERSEIELPGEELREKLHIALGTSEEDLVAVGILERIDSPVEGGQPVYIDAASITPGDRAAADAHAIRDGFALYDVPDARQRLYALIDSAGLTTAQLDALRAVVAAFRSDR